MKHILRLTVFTIVASIVAVGIVWTLRGRNLAPHATTFATSAAGDAVVVLETVVGGMTAPLDIAIRPAFPDDVVVAEQAGRLRIVRDGQLLETPLLDITDIVAAGGERGLLGVAPHPDPADDRVFVYYTVIDGSQHVSSFRAEAGDPDLLRRDSEVVLLSMEDPFPNHNGGGLAFGPDGYLYVSTGDGGGGGDPLGSGRDRGTLLGKILRLDVDVEGDARSPYGIPPDNPFVDQTGARPEIWHTGLRNPFRIRFDAATGRSLDRRCRAERLGGGRPGTQRRRRPRLRLEPARGHPLLRHGTL